MNAFEPGEEPDLNPGEPQEEIGNGESTDEDVMELKRQRKEREKQQKEQQKKYDNLPRQPQQQQQQQRQQKQQQQRQQPQVNSRRQHAFNVSLVICQLHEFYRLRKGSDVFPMSILFGLD